MQNSKAPDEDIETWSEPTITWLTIKRVEGGSNGDDEESNLFGS